MKQIYELHVNVCAFPETKWAVSATERVQEKEKGVWIQDQHQRPGQGTAVGISGDPRGAAPAAPGPRHSALSKRNTLGGAGDPCRDL